MAAAQIIVDEGLSHLSLRAVAARAGVSTTVIYSLVGKRDDLLRAVSIEARNSFVRAQREVEVSEDAVADLKELGRAYYGWALGNPALYGVMFGGHFKSQEADREPIEPLATAVQRLQIQGKLKAPDSWQVVWALWAAVHGAALLGITDCQFGDQGQELEKFEVLLEGIVRGLVKT
ncbi:MULTISPECIES: TetR/AcrR family transcriptional regulator [Rothia]|nr:MULTISPECIES: TetR/AcrR family transcriptional regulator [Rothia]